MQIKLTREALIDTALRAALAVLIFISICGAGFFCAWIGGVQPFTGQAGFISMLTFGVASVFASATFKRP